MEKKEELLTNAAKIISEEGMQKLTMEYLSEKSGITKGGVLYHFGSKDNLIIKMNEMAIQQYEDKISRYAKDLTGAYLFTRAYALATLDMLHEDEDVLLPAVFISSNEHQESKALWDRISEKWHLAFLEDRGDATKILELRMICDGIWFSMMYQYGADLKEDMKRIVEQHCERLEKEGI